MFFNRKETTGPHQPFRPLQWTQGATREEGDPLAVRPREDEAVRVAGAMLQDVTLTTTRHPHIPCPGKSIIPIAELFLKAISTELNWKTEKD